MNPDARPTAANGRFPYPHRNVAQVDEQSARMFPDIATVVPGTLCPRCGIRADISCEHRRAV